MRAAAGGIDLNSSRMGAPGRSPSGTGDTTNLLRASSPELCLRLSANSPTCYFRAAEANSRNPNPPQVVADHFPRRAHNQSMNSLSSRALPQSLSPLVPVFCLTPTPPLWKSASILHGFSRKTHGINQLIFLSVNYPVNFNPEKTPLSSPKGPALGAKRPHFRPFVALRLRPLDKCHSPKMPLQERLRAAREVLLGAIAQPLDRGLQHFRFWCIQNPCSKVAFSSRKSHLRCACNVNK